jgi:hypothetical protein
MHANNVDADKGEHDIPAAPAAKALRHLYRASRGVTRVPDTAG